MNLVIEFFNESTHASADDDKAPDVQRPFHLKEFSTDGCRSCNIMRSVA